MRRLLLGSVLSALCVGLTPTGVQACFLKLFRRDRCPAPVVDPLVCSSVLDPNNLPPPAAGI
jgi:hypothetical protein